MLKRTFRVKAVWDDEAKVFYSESDIEGLHIEAATLDQFEEIMMDEAIDMIISNHMSAADIASRSFKDIAPAIIWQRPDVREVA